MTASDDDPGHLVEAALDGFIVYDANPIVSTNLPSKDISQMRIQQNPFHRKTVVEFANLENSIYTLQIVDLYGHIVSQRSISNKTNTVEIGDDLLVGQYKVILRDHISVLQILTLVKI